MESLMRPMHWVFGLLALATIGSTADADSIWSRRDPRGAFLFTDNRARRVGDLLTVVIRENTGIDQRDKRALDKKSETGGIFKLTGSTTGNVNTRSTAADFDTLTTTNRKFDGKAEFTSERQFSDRVTATVIDVLPNGNLVIEGRRIRVVTGEQRALHISGVVRPSDIGPTNTIESPFVANFQISYEGQGADSSFSSQGWFSRVFNRVWPF